jgi:hypothetical protein
MTNHCTRTVHPARPHHHRITLLAALFLASLAGVSAHGVRGGNFPNAALAFVSSPTAETDAPVKVAWSGDDTELRVVCFYAANTSPKRVDDDDWPRVTAVGLELPDAPAGFTLLEPLNGDWQLVEGIQAAIPNRGAVTLDVAVVANVNPAGFAKGGPNLPLGIPPGQERKRGSGTRFCISGPFPDTLPKFGAPGQFVDTTIEFLLHGVVVGFHRVEHGGPSTDIGVWENPLRPVPLYPN